jgi:hypothetical protein
LKEKELKELFISSLKTGHIKNNQIFPSPESSDLEMRIKEEGYFRNFDLVISIIERNQNNVVKFDSVKTYDNYLNLLMRRGLITQFAKKERCSTKCVRFYPIELKSDDDVLDKRLSNQVLNAILTFGRSIVVLDHGHSTTVVKRRILELVPATWIGYTGKDDHFEILSVFDRLIINSVFNISKASVAKFLVENGLSQATENDKIYRCLGMIERINQKLAFTQFYNENLGLAEEEVEFMLRLTMENIPLFPSKKGLKKLIADSINAKITEYF